MEDPESVARIYEDTKTDSGQTVRVSITFSSLCLFSAPDSNRQSEEILLQLWQVSFHTPRPTDDNFTPELDTKWSHSTISSETPGAPDEVFLAASLFDDMAPAVAEIYVKRRAEWMDPVKDAAQMNQPGVQA